MENYLLLALLIKHAIIDIGIQRIQGPRDKQIYFSLKAHEHYGFHGLGTFIVFSIMVTPIIGLFLGIIDWICHWHIDYSKSQINMRNNLNQSHQNYWWLLTIDQILHYITYWILIYVYRIL